MNQTWGSSQRHWVGKIQYDRGWGSRVSPILMKYTTRMNLGVGNGYKVIQSLTTTQIARKTGELAHEVMLIVFAVVFIHQCECWVIFLHWYIPMTWIRGFAWIRPVRFSLFVPVILWSRFDNHAFLSTSFIALKFKNALSLVLVSQGRTPHAGLPACL